MKTCDEQQWKEARQQVLKISGKWRNLKTIKAPFKAIIEFLKMAPAGQEKDLNDQEAQSIAQRVNYGVTPGRIQRYYLYFKEFQASKSVNLQSGDSWIQNEDVKDFLIAVRSEAHCAFFPFPTVFQGYRPDPSNRLWRETEGDVLRIKWSLPIERDFLWPSFFTGFQAYLPTAAEALNMTKDSYARYCQRLVELEDHYQERAKHSVECGLDKVALNCSHFFRSILHEVDRDEFSPITECQYTISPTDEGVSVAYLGIVLLEARNEASAKEWIGLHLEWRQEIDRGELVQLRYHILEAARSLITGIEEVLARSMSIP
jgi:hypothetical protein